MPRTKQEIAKKKKKSVLQKKNYYFRLAKEGRGKEKTEIKLYVRQPMLLVLISALAFSH